MLTLGFIPVKSKNHNTTPPILTFEIPISICAQIKHKALPIPDP